MFKLNRNKFITIKTTSMKKLFFVVFALVTTVNSFAQDTTSKSPEKRATQFVKQLDKELDLTVEQSAKIESIQLKSIKKIDEIKTKGIGDDKKVLNKKTRDITKATNAEIKAILSDEQQTKFDAWLVQKKEKGNKQNL